MKVSRSLRRSGGKREAKRACHGAVTRIVELSREGRSVGGIAASAGVPAEFVRLVLSKAAEVEEGGGGGIPNG